MANLHQPKTQTLLCLCVTKGILSRLIQFVTWLKTVNSWSWMDMMKCDPTLCKAWQKTVLCCCCCCGRIKPEPGPDTVSSLFIKRTPDTKVNRFLRTVLHLNLTLMVMHTLGVAASGAIHHAAAQSEGEGLDLCYLMLTARASFITALMQPSRQIHLITAVLHRDLRAVSSQPGPVLRYRDEGRHVGPWCFVIWSCDEHRAPLYHFVFSVTRALSAKHTLFFFSKWQRQTEGTSTATQNGTVRILDSGPKLILQRFATFSTRPIEDTLRKGNSTDGHLAEIYSSLKKNNQV